MSIFSKILQYYLLWALLVSGYFAVLFLMYLLGAVPGSAAFLFELLTIPAFLFLLLLLGAGFTSIRKKPKATVIAGVIILLLTLFPILISFF